MPNIFDPEFDEVVEKDGYTKRRAWLARQAGAERLGASVWDIEPGAPAYRYHFHYGEEEMVVVISGRPTLRTPEGTRQLEPGELLSFKVGPEGAHQLLNETDETVRILSISTKNELDSVVYPDLGTTGLVFRPGTEEGFVRFHLDTDEYDLWGGEQPPSRDRD